MTKDKKIAIMGLGYVGLPLAVEFGKKFNTIGYDINSSRIKELSRGFDNTGEITKRKLQSSIKLSLTSSLNDIKDSNIYIIAVPTPINKNQKPDLDILFNVTLNVAKVLKKNDIVIYESTVYPGCTEEDCIPLLEKYSKLKYNKDFFCGYSPERINPGDKKRTVTKIVKITSGSNKKTADTVDDIYKSIIKAGTYKASSIRVAEAAKIIENCQRDINIAFVNEVMMLSKALNINSYEVLEAAKTKWNFLNFRPGLVGGHCIGVDPHYLTHKAMEVGYYPEIILAGRRLNDSMAKYVANEIITLMTKKRIQVVDSNILVMGLTFKEDCPDIRNTRVVDVIQELSGFHCNVDVYEPWIDKQESIRDYEITLVEQLEPGKYDAVIIAVAHHQFKSMGITAIRALGKKNHVLYDIKYILPTENVDGRL